MTKKSERYPEEKLAQAFLPWFKATTGYVELFEDIDTSGADPVDSAGWLGDDTLLIELKNKVGAGMIFYEGSRGSSIEKKICTALKNLYRGSADRVTQALGEWQPVKQPMFMLVANHYSWKSLKELKQLLDLRSPQWCFGYEIIQWTGEKTITLMKKDPSSATEPQLRSIEFPDMPSTAPPRRKSISVEECQLLSCEEGLQDVLSVFTEKLKLFGARRMGRINNVGYSFPNRNEGSNETVLAIWPTRFDRGKGILISYRKDRLQKCFDIKEDIDLEDYFPGEVGPVVGFLNSHRYLKSVSDVELFWEVLN